MSKTIRSFDRRACLATTAVLLFLLAGFALPGVAAERPLDQLRADGIVGERFDGYAVIRVAASSAVKTLVIQTNDQRRAVYQKRAAATKATAAAVGKIYAVEIFKNAPPGTWFQSESGAWTQKK